MAAILNSAFQNELNALHACYDENESMIRVPFSSPGYHTTLTGGMVHPTVNSLIYAVALMDSREEAYFHRAVNILKKVIPLQDTNSQNNTYGIWSWFLEEPLTQMSPPDWNWADFCGKQLLQVAVDYYDRLDCDLRKMLKEAILYACHSIMRRNMGPWYTNISLMGTYVTHVAGELFEHQEILSYAKERLENLYRFNMENGEFSEYNSPTYTIIAIEVISSMLMHIKDPQSIRMLEDLNDMAWGCVARHFHLPTQQWAGPHSRCYKNLLPKRLLSFIQIAAEGQIAFMKEEMLEIEIAWSRIKLHFPEKYYSYFNAIPTGRVEKKIFKRQETLPFIEMENGYYCEAYVLSSFYQAIFWNQRRPFMAYVGTADKPAYMQLRCLHNGYDYCSGHLHCVQERNIAIGVINFCTDGGDTHPNLDMLKNGTLKARDLRIRLEFGGDTDNIRTVEKIEERSFEININRLRITFKIADAVFGQAVVRYETGAEDGKQWVDVILFAGEETEINFHRLGKAYVAFALKIETLSENPQKQGEADDNILITHKDGKIQMVLQGEKVLALEAPESATPYKGLLESLTGTIDGIPYEKTCKG